MSPTGNRSSKIKSFRMPSIKKLREEFKHCLPCLWHEYNHTDEFIHWWLLVERSIFKDFTGFPTNLHMFNAVKQNAFQRFQDNLNVEQSQRPILHPAQMLVHFFNTCLRSFFAIRTTKLQKITKTLWSWTKDLPNTVVCARHCISIEHILQWIHCLLLLSVRRST